ncbi:MAG TPA: alpha/beta hydrolase [Pyrinomonadaceae bacterium]|nr:alpha/beta hydrolase [Pyrinomonadaceae bacterium]
MKLPTGRIFLLIFPLVISTVCCNQNSPLTQEIENKTEPATLSKVSEEIPIWTKSFPDSAFIKGEETYSDGIVKNVSNPTIKIFSPIKENSGAAVIVMPGGGYTKVAVDLEGSEICEWLASIGVTGILLKYRVPDSGPHYYSDCHCEKDPIKPLALQDAQRAISMVRSKAKQWNINPKKIGVMGFSAGGHLVADVSTNYRKRAYSLTDDIDNTDCRPDFGIVMFPGHMTNHTSNPYELNKKLPVDGNTPPTFILQAGNDPIDPIENSLVYYIALQKAKVHAEYHIYAEGGHAFGLDRTILDNPNWNKLPIADWENLVVRWLQTIKMTSN